MSDKLFQHLHLVGANAIQKFETVAELPDFAQAKPTGITPVAYISTLDKFYYFDGIAWAEWPAPTGAVGAAYTTIATDQGTFPIATAPGETLQFTSLDGSISVVGDQAQDRVNLQVNASSPGFVYSRAGEVLPGSFLLNGEIPSNISGQEMFVNSPIISTISVSNEEARTFDLEVFEHDKVTFTSLGTVSIIGVASTDFSVAFPATKGRELAVQVTSGSAQAARNIYVSLIISGQV